MKQNEKSIENPYLNAKRIWNEHETANTNARRMWQAVALISLFITLCSVSGLIYIGSQSKFVPYVVQVDKLGSAVAVRSADRMGTVSNVVIKAVLSEFIANARLVTPDVSFQRDVIYKLYSHIGDNSPARDKMNMFLNGFAERTPFARAAKEKVYTEITSVIPMSKDTWQVDWVEHTEGRDGKKISDVRWRAMLTISITPPDNSTSEEQLRRNPLGIYVNDFQWTRQI